MDLSYNAVPNLKADLKARKRLEEVGPDAPDPSLPKVWVMYVYSGPKRGWILAGFARYPHMSKRRLQSMRRKLHVNLVMTVEVMDLWRAAKTGGPVAAPDTTLRKAERPWHVPTPYLVETKPRRVRRTKNPELPARMFQKDLAKRFIVIGELADKRHHPIPTYLGLLFAETLADAWSEARKLFRSLYGKLHVFSLSELSKSLRRRIRKGRLHAGVTFVDIGGLINA
jgi:hypothetical protein